jgi:hypothetical protein
MKTSFTKIHRITAGASLAAACALWVGAMSRADGEEVGVEVYPRRSVQSSMFKVPGSWEINLGR